MKNKKGNISQIFTLVVSLAILIITIVYIINMLTPFIWYQKLKNIADKYVYVVERFGYLTDIEREELYKDLSKEGFDMAKITLECPKEKLEYGQMFSFNLKYNLNIEYGIFADGIKRDSKNILLHVKKYGYAKIWLDTVNVANSIFIY